MIHFSCFRLRKHLTDVTGGAQTLVNGTFWSPVSMETRGGEQEALRERRKSQIQSFFTRRY